MPKGLDFWKFELPNLNNLIESGKFHQSKGTEKGDKEADRCYKAASDRCDRLRGETQAKIDRRDKRGGKRIILPGSPELEGDDEG